MPELPEVEAARRAVEEHCVGKKIKKSVVADDPKVIDGVSPKDFQAALSGRTIVAAHRKGKNMWLELDSPPFPTFQFGMAGAVYIKGVAVTKYKRSAVKDTDEWPSKYSKLFVQLDDDLEFSFTDKRRFAKVRLVDNPVSTPPISELGPDALKEPMKEDEFYDALSKRKIGIKALLLDQGFISGIGNWMADEVLYQAKIHPLQTASSMSKESCATLLSCINEVIEKAIQVGADSSQFPSNWIFHSREKKPNKAFVDGKKIEFINAGGRTTAYVPQLQKLAGNQEQEVGKLSKGTSDDNSGETAKKGKRTSNRAREPSVKRKSSASADDDSEEDGKAGNASRAKGKSKVHAENNVGRKQARGKTKRKHEESEDEDEEVKNGKGSSNQKAKSQKKKTK